MAVFLTKFVKQHCSPGRTGGYTVFRHYLARLANGDVIEQAQMKRAPIPVWALLVIGSALGQSPPPAKIRITTWNLGWLPN
jgi:hypothetical protein